MTPTSCAALAVKIAYLWVSLELSGTGRETLPMLLPIMTQTMISKITIGCTTTGGNGRVSTTVTLHRYCHADVQMTHICLVYEVTLRSALHAKLVTCRQTHFNLHQHRGTVFPLKPQYGNTDLCETTAHPLRVAMQNLDGETRGSPGAGAADLGRRMPRHSSAVSQTADTTCANTAHIPRSNELTIDAGAAHGAPKRSMTMTIHP